MADQFVRVYLAEGEESQLSAVDVDDYVEFTGFINGQEIPVRFYRPGDTDEPLPEASPAFSAHFRDPLYEDPSSEFAPFGSDEGADMLTAWSQDRHLLTAGSTVADLLGDSGDALEELLEDLDGEVDPTTRSAPDGFVDAAFQITSAAFTLLRLTGRIDEPGRQAALTALTALIDLYDSPEELLRQRDDLASWRN